MLAPFLTRVPSEATIEQIANHQILNAIGPYSAWFYVPTRREEQRLAYDASLQGYKALVIQYKRFSPCGTIRLNKHQHQTLLSNFPPRSSPYVFYGFSSHVSYAQLNEQFTAGRGFLFGFQAHFVNAHQIPSGMPSICFRGPCCEARVKLGRGGTCVDAYSLVDLVAAFLACKVGIQPQRQEVPRAPSGERVAIPHLNILWASV